MLYYLQNLDDWFGPFRLFKYITFRAGGAAITAFLLCLLLGSPLIDWLRRLRFGQEIRGADEVHKLHELHRSKAGTPTMGGLLILFAITGSTLLWARPTDQFVLTTLFCTLYLGIVGFADDYLKIRYRRSKGLIATQKLLLQILLGLAIVIYLWSDQQTYETSRRLMVPFMKTPLIADLGLFTILFIVLILVATANAVNLTDGLDGLAVGCSVIAAGMFAIITYIAANKIFSDYLNVPHLRNAGELTVFCAALFGAGLGFLWFNCHPAKMFMGDTGSLALGGALGIVAILIKQELTLILIGGVFVIEAASVILQVASFKLTGKRIFLMSPLHHHFELKGWSETTVTVRFWILAIIFGLFGLSSLKLR